MAAGLGVLIYVGRVIFAGPYTSKWPVWVFVEKGVKICRFAVVRGLLAVDAGLVVETGPGGVGRRQN